MGLVASRGTENKLSRNEVIQIIADEMGDDPDGRIGQNALKSRIALRTGFILRGKSVKLGGIPSGS
jgi:hypothetical protein